MFYQNLYAPFHNLEAKDDEDWTVKNCFVHLLSEDKIDISAFERLFSYGGIAGDIDWGIEKWNQYTKEDHGIHDYFEGYLFFIGQDEHGLYDKGELQIILSKPEITPYFINIIKWYKDKDIAGTEKLEKLLRENHFIENTDLEI